MKQTAMPCIAAIGRRALRQPGHLLLVATLTGCGGQYAGEAVDSRSADLRLADLAPEATENETAEDPLDAPVSSASATNLRTIEVRTEDGEMLSVTVEEIDGTYVMEGDIVLGPVSAGPVPLPGDVSPAVGIRRFLRWDQARIPYFLPESHPKRALIESAIQHLNETTVLWFVPVTDVGAPYLSIRNGDACQSGVGLAFWGDAQSTTIGPGCGRTEILHELLHAAGLSHEQTRLDRDDHVTIFWDNIDPDKHHNFEMHGDLFSLSIDIGPYDLDSIMHYDSFAFAIDATSPTIVRKSGAVIARNADLSAGDRNALRAMYGSIPHPDKPRPSSNPYQYVARSADLGAPSAAGAPFGFAFPALGVTDILYRDGNAQLHELWQQGASRGKVNLTRLSGAVGAAGDPMAFLSLDGHIVAPYRGTNGQIYSMYWNTGGVGIDALSRTAGAPLAAGNPTGYAGSDGWSHVFYRATNGSLQDLYWFGQGTVAAQNLTSLAQAPSVTGDPSAYFNPNNGENIIAYRGADRHIHTLYYTGSGGVGHDELSASAGSPRAAGNPYAYHRANDDSHQVLYRGDDGHIYELQWVGFAPVQFVDLTAAAQARNAASDPVGIYDPVANTKHVFFVTDNGHLNEIVWTAGQSTYEDADLTVIAVIPLTAASKPSAFMVGDRQHVVYRGTDNAIHEVSWQ